MNNNTPARLTNLEITPHDCYSSSRRQYQTTATSTTTTTTKTTTTTTTNVTLAHTESTPKSRLEIVTQKDLEEIYGREGLQGDADISYTSSSNTHTNTNTTTCTNTNRNHNKYKNVYTHNTSATTTESSEAMTTSRSSWARCWWAGLRPSAAACVTLLIITTTCSLCSASLCESQSWWDSDKDKCIPCTVCQGDMIPLRPCQMHRDTVCGSIYDLEIDWVVLSKTEPNWKERRKFDGLDYGGLDHHQLTAEQLQQLQDDADPMDWQTAALFLAVLACLLFFIVAACILVHHMRQWRRMERRLDQDVEELSTKLMAKLAEVQSLEGGTFFIGNADALRIPTTAAGPTFQQPQHVMLPEKSDKHHQGLQHDRRLLNNLTTLKSGNVYIEENNSKC